MFPDIKCTSPPDFQCQWWKSLQTVFCQILWATFEPDGLALHPELIGHPQKISDDPKITRLVEHDSLMYVIVHSHRVFSRRLCTLPPEPLCMLSSHVHHCIVLYPLPFDCRGAGCGILTLTSDQAVFDIWSQGSMCIRDVTYPRKIVMLCFGRSIWSEGVKSKIVEQSWLFVPAPHCWSVHCDKEKNKPKTKFYNQQMFWVCKLSDQLQLFWVPTHTWTLVQREKWIGAHVESDSGQGSRVISSLVRSLLGGMDLIELLTSRETGFLPTIVIEAAQWHTRCLISGLSHLYLRPYKADRTQGWWGWLRF